MADYVGALDQGTTSTRFMVYDHGGRMVSQAQREHRQIFPHPGWVEHDPLEIWANAQSVIQEALTEAGLRGSDLAGIGITNQRETTVLWDRESGEPLHNAIVWQCTRTQDLCRELAREGGQDRFRRTTGLPVATYFSGTKMAWLLDEVPGARRALEKGRALMGTMETWLIWLLTGGPAGGAYVTDVTNASRTMLMNLSSLQWEDEILRILGIPGQALPRIVPSSDPEPWGYTLPGGPLGARVPVCGALGDQQAALVGQACFAPGEAKNTYGTGCFLLLNTGPDQVTSSHGLLTTVGYQLGRARPVYCLEGSIAVAGALVQWVRDNLGIIGDASEIEQMAAQAGDNGGVYCVPAFSGLFAPHWRADARGVIVGLSGYADKRHLARAVLEATAYQTKDIVEAMNRDSGVELKRLKVDGGMVANELLMQFQADVLDVAVIRSQTNETTSLGAAYAAGLAVGFWESLEELRKNWAESRRWLPSMTPRQRKAGYANWQKAVERSLGWVDQEQ
ncbi:MAG: glycerol kinase GlpK [Desulfarculaceae bacterium]|nr:glycerol kinase GlpK [Desulfarculaceae bacterium]MCF8071513.1 glycerol kinase GlpK [Desulfarculaceae bacterium]MCF8102328.1 glycerol kinase GlpK [Desulfarculaceae bacterium]MCF8114792.1 glycerol kinase GlpK [Desulfarculaceae bacterium]